MPTCPKCKKENAQGAKFCRFCGTPLAGGSKEKKCPDCGKLVPEEAKFCRHCGYKFENANIIPSAEDSVETHGHYVTWNVLPGQLAVKIDQSDLEAIGTVNGLIVAPGIKALLFADGKLLGELPSGRYKFKDYGTVNSKKPEFMTETEEVKEEPKKKGFFGFVKNLFHKVIHPFEKKKKEKAVASYKPNTVFTIVLIRAVEFPLVFDLKNVTTKNIRCDVGVQLRCRIMNMNDFFENQLVDKKFVSFDSLAKDYMPVVQDVVNNALKNVSPEEVENNEQLKTDVFNALKVRFDDVYVFFNLDHIVSLTATREELENIRRMKEELYVSEQELEQVQLRNDFLNRLQSEEYQNQVRAASAEVDFEELMEKVDERHQLNEDQKERFALMLEAQRIIRTAETQEEVNLATDKLQKSRMLSEDELATLSEELEHRHAMTGIAHEHEQNKAALTNEFELAMVTLQSEKALDAEKLDWEIQIGNKRFENELYKQKLQDDYADSRRDTERDHRAKDHDQDQKEMLDQMELLRQAQKIRQEREDAEHARDMERRRLDAETKLEDKRITATMSFEQIMASNPNISPAAAAALAKKFEADAAAANSQQLLEAERRHQQDLKDMYRDQMEMSKQILAAGTATQAQRLADKEAEIERVRSDAGAANDRVLSGVETSLNAFSRAQSGVHSAHAYQAAPVAPKTKVCPKCGKECDADAFCCDECGTTL